MASRLEHRQSARRARIDGDAVALAFALRHLSDLDRVAGHAEPALAQASEAVDLYRALGDAHRLDLANALRLRALANPDFEAARSDWREARVLYTLLKIDAGMAECDARLA